MHIGYDCLVKTEMLMSFGMLLLGLLGYPFLVHLAMACMNRGTRHGCELHIHVAVLTVLMCGTMRVSCSLQH